MRATSVGKNEEIEIDPVFGCLLVAGRLDRNGYVLIGLELAHKVIYEREVGPIPEGLVLDHLCRRRNCVALHHLEPVTKSENEKRKSWKYRVKRAMCIRGHELNLYAQVTPEGGRVCRKCTTLAGWLNTSGGTI